MGCWRYELDGRDEGGRKVKQICFMGGWKVGRTCFQHLFRCRDDFVIFVYCWFEFLLEIAYAGVRRRVRMNSSVFKSNTYNNAGFAMKMLAWFIDLINNLRRGLVWTCSQKLSIHGIHPTVAKTSQPITSLTLSIKWNLKPVKG